MSGIKIEKIILKNFKCHKDFETDLKQLNILTGSNAAGKSSLIQALLLAFKSWKECEKKRINTNKIYDMTRNTSEYCFRRFGREEYRD